MECSRGSGVHDPYEDGPGQPRSFPGNGLLPEHLSVPRSRRLVLGAYLVDHDLEVDQILIIAITPAAKPEVILAHDDDLDEDQEHAPGGFPGP